MSHRFAKTAAAVATAATLGLLGWGVHQAFQPQALPLQGQFEAQEINVSSKVPGRVAQVLVQPGQQVKAGELLVRIDSPEVAAKLQQAQSSQAAAQAVADKALSGARPQEIDMARLNWERAKTAANLAQTTYTRVEAMYQEGVLAQQKRDDALAQARAAQEQAQAAQAQYDMARQGARPQDIRAAQAQAAQVGGVVQEVKAAEAETRILAPLAAEVAKVQIQAGELAPQGFPIVTLVNLADSWVVLAVREDEVAHYALGSVHTGHVNALGTDARFKVTASAVLPDFATWRAARPGGTDLRTFEVRLRPEQPIAGLRPGMGVRFAPH